MTRREIPFGVIGCGLMGREFASAAARWCHLLDVDFRPVIVAVSDTSAPAMEWFSSHVPTVWRAYADYRDLLGDPGVEAVYCAVPHHLHAAIYEDAMAAGKHLMGEKPFGIDEPANARVLASVRRHPELTVRCSSEFPFYPGAYRIAQMVRERAFGTILEVEAGFWHSSDLDPLKPLNWKRRSAENGRYGSMGDLGLHVVHLPLLFGWVPHDVRAILQRVYPQRPDRDGRLQPTDTWDNAVLLCEVRTQPQAFPLLLSTKRVAPGHANTWFLRIVGTRNSAWFSTRNPKTLVTLPYEPGGEQAERRVDLPYQSAYRTVTGGIFEFGFSDAVLQMWAAYCDELTHGQGMEQPLRCASPEITAMSHRLFTAALRSQETGATVPLGSEPTLPEGVTGSC